MVIVQSLWVGNDLTDMEKYCIRSFLNTGHEFHLYTYGKIGGIPKGVKIKDGNQIMPAKEVFQLKKTFFVHIKSHKYLFHHFQEKLDTTCQMLDGLNNAQNSNPKYCVIYNAPYSFLRKIAMQIKQIDNVLTITLRDFEG